MERKPQAQALRALLSDFIELAEAAEPEELQRLLRQMVRRIVWSPQGHNTLELYDLSDGRSPDEGANDEGLKNREQKKQKMPNQETSATEGDWFDISMWSGCPDRLSMKPLILRVKHWLNSIIPEATTLLHFNTH